ncbi:MAG: hypothetical protein A2V93_10505 [Ignavibacteria bacterium RBG_16_34_14]|nr:MAG: hypothetical protein A2V93_10505 [Ignavibacteria bacterium RBG_16_34_14]
MNPSAKNKLDKILSDNKSGSTEILLKLIKWSKNNIGSKESLFQMIDAANKKLKTFVVIQSFTKDFKRIIKGNNKSKILDFLNEKVKRIENRYSILFWNTLPYLKNCKKIVTLSNSKTVAEILKKLNKQRKIYVTIGESRPQFEGRIMTKALLKQKIKVEIVVDALLQNVVEKSDAVIIGADIVLSNGDVVNKIGSRGLAIACKYFQKPFYVLATSDKFSNKKKYYPEKKNENEIWNYNSKILSKTNNYFEVVEKKLITRVIKD